MLSHMSLEVANFWMKGTFHVTRSASATFSLKKDPALDGSLPGLGMQDTGRAVGSLSAALSLHTELLLCG